VRRFVLQYLNRINDARVNEFLDDEFDKGLEEGSWLFLFDSFDELPAVLGSTESDQLVQKYAQAIDQFLQGMTNCRGIVASRLFRGPNTIRWTKFRILELSEDRQRELIYKADLPSTAQRELIASLANAADDIRVMARNPIFLGLICDHVESGRPFPPNA